MKLGRIRLIGDPKEKRVCQLEQAKLLKIYNFMGYIIAVKLTVLLHRTRYQKLFM